MVPLWLSCEHQSFPRYVLFHVGLEYKSISLRITPPCSVQVQDHFSEQSLTKHLSRTVATSGTLRLRIIEISISSVMQRLSTEAALRSVRGNIGWRKTTRVLRLSFRSKWNPFDGTERFRLRSEIPEKRSECDCGTDVFDGISDPVRNFITTQAFAIQITLLRWSMVLARRASVFAPLGLKFFTNAHTAQPLPDGHLSFTWCSEEVAIVSLAVPRWNRVTSARKKGGDPRTGQTRKGTTRTLAQKPWGGSVWQAR